ncbi:MAG: hypothetical protein ABSF69_20925 [Polyangiaceae bacterium]|jgi:hypothetical protein
MNAWKAIAAGSAFAFAFAVAVACTPAAPPGPAACANQPNMAAAVHSLEVARAWLGRAEHNKGGWREAALVATDTALRETVRGCQFADTH